MPPRYVAVSRAVYGYLLTIICFTRTKKAKGFTYVVGNKKQTVVNLILFHRPDVPLDIQEQPIMSKLPKQRKASPSPSKKKGKMVKSKEVISDSEQSSGLVPFPVVFLFVLDSFSMLALSGEYVSWQRMPVTRRRRQSCHLRHL